MMDEIDALTSEVSAISNNINSPDGFLANAKPLIIGNAKRWQGTTKGTHVVLNIKGGDIITITASNINRAIYAVLKNYKPIVDKAVDFSEADGFTDRILQDKGTEKTFTIPADGNYLCVNLNYETSIYTPSKIKINGVEITYGVRKVVDELQQNVVDINAAMNKDFFITKPNLPSATNLDDIRETGYYNLATNGTFVNAPAKITRAFLCVFATSASVPRQLLCDLSNGCLYIRYRADGVWTEWQEIISLHQLKLNLSRNEKRKAVDHGGIYSNRAYENSPKAFYDAYKEGIVYHNVDIVFSSDGVPFVFHDNQTTDIAGTAFKFSDLTAAQIRMHKVGDNDYSWIPQELAEVDKHIKALGGSIEMIDVTAPNTQASIANAGNLPNYYRINNIKPAWTNYDYSSMRDAFISNGNQFGVYIVINSESEMQAAIEYIRSRSGIKFAVNIAYDACIGFIHNYIGELAGLGVAIYTGAFGGVESIRDADIQWADGILSERCNANYAEYMYYAKP